jgi:7-cyano-7-deazaguanine synthase
VKTALLLSGGMDSICIAWWKRPDIAITIDYGQAAARAEVMAASAVCEQLGIEHHVIQVDCRSLGSGDMAGRAADAAAPASDWWPYRNQLLITLSAMKVIALGAQKLYIGTVRSDELHKDGTTRFVELIDELLRYQEGELRVEAPAIALSTTELARSTQVPADLIAWAHSCHKANLPCGKCRGCNKYDASMFDLGYACEL